MIIYQAIALGIGFLLNALLGSSSVVSLPSRGIRGLVHLFERAAKKIFPKSKVGKIISGIVALILTIIIYGGISVVILFFAYRFHTAAGVCAEAVLCCFMLGAGALRRNGAYIYSSLMAEDIRGAEDDLSLLTGYKETNLEGEDITKSAVEYIAESTVFKAISPIIYMAIGGGCAGFIYGIINIMSTYADLNDKYFGTFANTLNNILNFIPARISAYFMILSAYILGYDGANAAAVYRSVLRAHSDINAVCPISAAAGALHIQLGGDGRRSKKRNAYPIIGESLRDITFGNIRQTSRMMYLSAIITTALCIGIKIAIFRLI